MKWFAALNHGAFEADRYAALLVVAVQTALTYTSLIPHVLYDGPETRLTQWLRTKGVTVHQCRSFLHDRLEQIARVKGDRNILAIGAGAFLRMEAPRIALQTSLDDDFVLYTDVDVMFMNDPCEALSRLRPRLFAVGAEFTIGDYINMNSGVMLMNLPRLRRADAGFRRFVENHLDALVTQNWDQGAYRRYFGRRQLPARIAGTRWDHLPPEFNWKPYWGANPLASIIHFHGPKPQDRATLGLGDPGHREPWTVAFATGAYQELSALWRTVLDASGF